jgi:hypothetical protein
MNKRPECDTTNPPGQIVNPVGTPYIPKPGTLGMYIDKALKHEAMLDRISGKKKLTFSEWIATGYRLLPEGSDALEECWKAAQENV